MPTSRAGSYDGNWSLIVGCLPCVVGYHLQLVVFLIGSHLWLGHIGKKTDSKRLPPKMNACHRRPPKKGTISKKRLHLPTLGFSPDIRAFCGGKDLVLKLRAETSSSSTWKLLSLEGGRPRGL